MSYHELEVALNQLAAVEPRPAIVSAGPMWHTTTDLKEILGSEAAAQQLVSLIQKRLEEWKEKGGDLTYG